MPYHRNPNVILAQHEAAQQNTRLQHGEEEEGTQGQEPVLDRHGWRHYLNPASWFRSLARRRRERGVARDMEQGIQGTSYEEKPRDSRLHDQKDTMLQVAILIEMPSQTSHTLEHGVCPPAYEIGVASIPWTDDFNESSCPGRRSSSSSSD